jgi:aarF domain-containing kinase
MYMTCISLQTQTGQVISTRVDLFPPAYTDKLAQLQDGIEPMPFKLVEGVVRQELLDGAPLSDLFLSFDEEPLGAASIAQVHKATLLDGRTVAVKLQRPNVEPKLLGDVANLKRISKALAKSLPVDYYTVFSELGEALVNELDFLSEASAMRKISYAVSHCNDGTPADPPLTVPLPVGELVSKRVLVMDFVEGTPLNRLQETMKERGIEPGSPEAKIAGRRILNSLSSAFGKLWIRSKATDISLPRNEQNIVRSPLRLSHTQ